MTTKSLMVGCVYVCVLGGGVGDTWTVRFLHYVAGDWRLLYVGMDDALIFVPKIIYNSKMQCIYYRK